MTRFFIHIVTFSMLCACSSQEPAPEQQQDAAVNTQEPQDKTRADAESVFVGRWVASVEDPYGPGQMAVHVTIVPNGSSFMVTAKTYSEHNIKDKIYSGTVENEIMKLGSDGGDIMYVVADDKIYIDGIGYMRDYDGH